VPVLQDLDRIKTGNQSGDRWPLVVKRPRSWNSGEKKSKVKREISCRERSHENRGGTYLKRNGLVREETPTKTPRPEGPVYQGEDQKGKGVGLWGIGKQGGLI